jgi:hypothetical protein
VLHDEQALHIQMPSAQPEALGLPSIKKKQGR